MHTSTDFLPELLQQPHLEHQVRIRYSPLIFASLLHARTQVFGMHLLSFVAEKYPMPSTMALCHSVLQNYARVDSATLPAHIPALRRVLHPLVQL